MTANQPLYREISYLLVSLECLIGSKYLSKVEERGLAQQYNYSMGRREAEYLDPRIGLLSYNAQLWVDRNFSLDYTVKSIEKITHKETRHLIRDLRTVIKDYAYGLLAKFLAVITGDLSLIQIDLVKNVGSLKRISARWDNSMIDVKKNQYLLREIMDEHFEYMKQDFEKSYANIIGYIGEIDREKMGNIIDSWKTKKEWHLINPVRP